MTEAPTKEPRRTDYDNFMDFTKNELEAKNECAIFPIDLIKFAETYPESLVITIYQYGFAKRTKKRESYPIWHLYYNYKGKFNSFEGTRDEMYERANKLQVEVAVPNDLIFVHKGGGCLMSEGRIFGNTTDTHNKFINAYKASIGKSHLKTALIPYQSADHLKNMVKRYHEL